MLRTLFQDPDFACTIGVHVDPKLFTSKARRWLAGALIGYAKRHGSGASMDAIKIQRRRDLRAGILRKEDLEAVDASIERLPINVKDRSFIKEETFRFVKYQVFREAFMNSVDFIDKGNFDGVDQEISRILGVSAAGMGGLGHRYVTDAEKRFAARKVKTATGGVPTGTPFDKWTKYGGLWRKALGVVVGPYNGGKTSTLISMARAAVLEAGKKSLFVSLELDEGMVCDKFDAGFADVSISDLEDEEEVVRETVKDLGMRYGDFLVVKYFPSDSIGVPHLKAYIRQLERISFYPDVIFVDTVEIMKPSVEVRSGKRWEGEGNTYLEFRGLLGELDVPGWTAAQLSREGIEKKTATGAQTGGSIQKMQICDVSLIINQDERERKAKIARLLLDKNRGGPSKIEMPAHADWARCVVSDPN